MDDDFKRISDYLSIAWRRKVLIIYTFLIGFSLIAIVVSQLPARYKSVGTILIKSQQIPEELVQSTVTGFANVRISALSQRLLSTQQLQEIIDKFQLYEEESKNSSTTEILAGMRKRIEIKQISADLSSRRRRSSAIMSFTIGFEYQVPELAQKVTNELVTLFLDENVRSRTASAVETTEFLEKESDRLRSQIEEIEEKIADYKQKNKGSLPENLNLNLTRQKELKQLLFSSKREMSELAEKRKLLLIDLDIAERVALITPGGNKQLLSAEVEKLRAQYSSLLTQHGESDSNVEALKTKISEMETESRELDEKNLLETQLKQVRAEITELSQKYSDQHPDIKRLKRKQKSLTQALDYFLIKATPSNNNKKSAEVLQATARINAIDDSINSLNQAQLDLVDQIEEFNQKINRTPQVERGMDALERDHEIMAIKYQKIRNKLQKAELSMNLEEEQKSEQFTLLEPPRVPHKPSKPNRFQLLLLGLVLSLGLGAGAAAVTESLDSGIRGSRTLANVTKSIPLVTIPYIATMKDQAIKKRNIVLSICALITFGILMLLFVHYFSLLSR